MGQAAARANKADLKAKVDEVTAKFLMPELKGVNSALKLAALRAMTDLAAALHDEEMWSASDKRPRLAHHGDLMHEAIACLKVSQSVPPVHCTELDDKERICIFFCIPRTRRGV